MTDPQQNGVSTVGDTIWIALRVDLPSGRTLRAADWEAADPVQLLGPPRITQGAGNAVVSYPVAVWRPGTHTVQIPGPLLLAADGAVDSLPGETLTLTVASVLPRPATDTTLRPQPRAEFVPRPSTTPVPLPVLLLLAALILVPLHSWWRRRGKPAPGSVAEPAVPAPPLERWASAGESRAVAAVAMARLRLAMAERLPDARPALDTESVLHHVAEHRPDWPLAQLAEVLRELDRARFAVGAAPDALALSGRAADLERRLPLEAV
jgi:hypothetical protein